MRRWGSSGMPKAYLGPGVTSRSTVWLWAGTLLVRRWRSSVPVQSGGPGIDGRLNRVSLVADHSLGSALPRTWRSNIGQLAWAR